MHLPLLRPQVLELARLAGEQVQAAVEEEEEDRKREEEGVAALVAPARADAKTSPNIVVCRVSRRIVS